jgi:hypothetical protein
VINLLGSFGVDLQMLESKFGSTLIFFGGGGYGSLKAVGGNFSRPPSGSFQQLP